MIKYQGKKPDRNDKTRSNGVNTQIPLARKINSVFENRHLIFNEAVLPTENIEKSRKYLSLFRR